MARVTKPKATKQVETIKHSEAKRKNIPTAELQSAAQRAEEINPAKPVVYSRNMPLAKGQTRNRNEDLDPQVMWKGARIRLNEDQIRHISQHGFIDIDEAQIVWRGKDQQDWSDLVVHAPPLYIQEKIHPKVIIDDLMRQSEKRRDNNEGMFDLFHDFNGIDPEAKTEFYEHDQNWSNRMILGDSMQVMAGLAEREGLRGQVQCIFFDPPYGIKFKSNWQVSTRSNVMSDTNKHEEITREPEQVQAFRDTWKDGIHSYLTYLRDRLTAMRDLLTESGSIFVQISDENVHRIRLLLDEVFGEENFISIINFRKKTMPLGSNFLEQMSDHIIWYAKSKSHAKSRSLYREYDVSGLQDWKWVEEPNGNRRQMNPDEHSNHNNLKDGSRVYRLKHPSPIGNSESKKFPVEFQGKTYQAPGNGWGVDEQKMDILRKAGRVQEKGNTLNYILFNSDSPISKLTNPWMDTVGPQDKKYVVQTSDEVVKRCILMTTDPGDLVLDPTCGSGTSAHVAEQWGRRWITIDTSRVALALTRARIMGARYPYYLLSDSKDGRQKEGEVGGRVPMDGSCFDDIRQGFVYERAPRVTLKSIANNSEIEVIWQNYQSKLEPIRQKLNSVLSKTWKEWEVPNDISDIIGSEGGFQKIVLSVPLNEVRQIHTSWFELLEARQREINNSIARKAEVEPLFDKPYEDRSRVRVAGPFTVESLSPHRVIASDENEFINVVSDGKHSRIGAPHQDFSQMIMEHLKSAGVHQASKDDKVSFTSITGWPGNYIAAEGQFLEGNKDKRAAIFIGPEFGTVTRADLTAAAREALDARFDALIACGFNFEAHTSELTKLGPLPILKAKINPDLHMSDELKNTGAGNLFIVFGEPDIEWNFDEDGNILVEVLGIDVFDPKTGAVRASGKDDIAAWFIDTDYNEESFFVRHAYFLGAQDPYKSLKSALKAEIDADAWETLYRDKSRAFARPESGRFAVKVINHFGDEVMKVFTV